MSATPPPQDPSPSSQRKTSGVLLALAVAGSVFGLGNVIVGQFTQHVELPAAPAMAGRAGSSPSFSPSRPDSGNGLDAGAPVTDGGDGGASTDAPHARDAVAMGDARIEAANQGRDAGVPPHVEEGKATVAEDAPGKTDDQPRSSAGGDCELPEKDIAREAWRRNVPTICVGGSGKSQRISLYLPVKGATNDATYDYRRKQRLVRITAPSAGSQLTMVQYKLRRHGFHELKIAPEGNGSKFRLTIEKGFPDPAVELKESFIKVVLAAPTSDAE